jgi:hypothetical protein
LTDDYISIFSNAALLRISEEGDKKYGAIFFKSVLLILYLLRYRRISPGYATNDQPETLKKYDKCKKFLNNAIDYFSDDPQKMLKCNIILQEFNNYLNFTALLDIPTQLIEMAEIFDDNEDEDVDDD